jgi:hypothetical protein
MRIMREDYDKTSLASHQPAVRSGTTRRLRRPRRGGRMPHGWTPDA